MVDGEVEENNVMVCRSLILTVSAMIASENQKMTPMPEAEVKHAVELLERAGKVCVINCYLSLFVVLFSIRN